MLPAPVLLTALVAPLLLAGAATAQIPAADTVPPADSLPPASAVPVADTLGDSGEGAAGDTIPAPGEGALESVVTDLTDLGVRFRGRMELGGDWTRFRPCDANVRTSCDPSLIPRLTPDFQFGVQLAGEVTERIHVDVDYDETREFSATNNVNVYYQGRQGELLQRVEVGDVSFDLPDSRFLTQGIPAGNFGFRADGEAGPFSLQTVWAEQSGDLSSRTFRLSGFGDDRAFVQEDTLVLDDADYARGQFFFLVDPRALAGYPHVDPLALTPSAAPDSVVPGAPPVQLYRFETDPVTRQQVEGYIQADAVASLNGEEVRESGWFRYLQPGVDYTVHASGLWVGLRRPLGRDEMLAVTYVTAAGDTVGQYNPERIYNAGGRPRLRLLKAAGASHQPGRPTWDLEMHNVYRVSGSDDVEPGSVQLTISLGERSAGRTFKRGPRGSDITFLRLFGLDEQSPVDELDRTSLYTPAQESLLDRPPVSGTFLFFPTLEPFREPPPLPSLNLTAEETGGILGTDANPTIYESLDPFERENGGLYRLTIPFRIRSRGVISSFSLGALGVRDGSERIWIGDRLLERGTDYRIDYEVGQVVLLDPDALFASAPDAEVRAIWEQKSVFRLASTSVFGLKARYDLGDHGGLDLLALRQSEDALTNRPTLGVEPSAITLGGISGGLEFGASWLDAALARVPGLRPGDSSSVSVQGEVALSLPEPNTRGDVFLDDFDAANAVPLSLLDFDWHLGSAPASVEGAADVLPAGLDAVTATTLVWQHTWVEQTPAGDSLGVLEGFFPREEIDRQIRVAGTSRREPGMLVTFGRPGEEPVADRRWRSVTTLLSPQGMDLTKSDFLEFYVARGESLTLVLDLGIVDEDAFFVDREGRTSGTQAETGEAWGLGILDEEADPRLGEIWSDAADLRGVWGEGCMAERGRVYREGDPRANCPRGNGRPDTEDLDGNGNLDDTERHLRYVVRLDDSSPYLARTREETGTQFRLFRIPIRGPGAVRVGGFVPESDLRSVKHLRLTAVGDGRASLILARMRIVGSRWVKRAGDGVIRGIHGEAPGVGGRVDVGPVSELSEGAAYASPPGVLEQLDDPTAAFGEGGVEFKERGLGLDFEEIGADERVEVFNRFPQRPRDFLTYRRLRIWAVAREGEGWGVGGPLRFFVKVGSDADNFYLYRTTLEPAADPGAVRGQDWTPEVVVEFDRWTELRRQAEIALVEGSAESGSGPVEVWDADSTYAIVLQDRGRAPNLAAVRELSVGVWNDGSQIESGEMWVNELRLGAGFGDVGSAGHVNVDVAAGEVLSTRLTVSDRGAFFRQLETPIPYQEARSLAVTSTLSLDRFAPEGWGLRAPVTVAHSRSSRDPFFLEGSDLRADRLATLREPGDRQTRLSVTIRREVEEEDPSWVQVVTGGLEAGAGWSRSRSTTVTSELASNGVDARLGWSRRPQGRQVPVIPAFLEGVIDALLPGFLEDRIQQSRFRWSPERISLGTSYFRRESEALRFAEIVRLASDAEVRPTPSPREGLETNARIDLRPFRSLSAGIELLTVRDLLAPEEAIGDPAVQVLLRRERSGLGGLDLGWETNRTLRTRLGWEPRLVGWLASDLSLTTYYGSIRDANLVERRLQNQDTVLELQRSVSGQRDVRAAFRLDPDSLAGALAGAPEPGDGTAERTLQSVLRALEPASFTWEDGITSRFDREAVDPGAGFQFGWGAEDSFRVLQGDTAALLSDRSAWRAEGGVRLPLELLVNVRYSESRGRTLDSRSERVLERVTWPDLSARVADLPLPGSLRAALTRVSLSVGLRESEQLLSFGRGGEQLRSEVSDEVPVDVSLSWAGGLRTRYRGLFQDGRGSDPTGETDRDRVLHGVSVTASLQPPGGMRGRLDRPVQISLGLQYSLDRNCRVPLGQTECVPFVDRLNRSVNLTMDTSVSDLELGLTLNFVDRQSSVGQRLGSTQFQLGFFGQFQFSAGDLPRFGSPPGGR